jgi:hypothetical protein
VKADKGEPAGGPIATCVCRQRVPTQLACTQANEDRRDDRYGEAEGAHGRSDCRARRLAADAPHPWPPSESKTTLKIKAPPATLLPLPNR